MLHTLDPHSSFFEPRDYAQMRERQRASYSGLGITIQSIDGDITVMSIFEGSPAYKRGCAAATSSRASKGDGHEGLDDASRRSSKLKGPRARWSTSRSGARGYDGLIDMDVVRDEVNITTVRGAFMIDRETGYVKLEEFSETSDEEIGDRAQEAERQGHEAADVRPPRQSRRPARSGDPHLQPVPAARAT